MGPDGAYLVQHVGNTRIFWADRHELALGACFKGKTGAVPRELLPGVGPGPLRQPHSFVVLALHATSNTNAWSAG